MLARGTKIFVPPGDYGFSFFQVKMFTGSGRVLLTSVSLKLKINLKYSSISSHRGSELSLVGVK